MATQVRSTQLTQARPNLVRWGAVFSGVVTSLALFVLASTLWLALAYDSGFAYWQNTLQWWVAGTAIAAFLIAGAMAGALSGARGVGPGLANAATVWGLVTVVALFGGLPLSIGYFGGGSLGLPHTTLWTTFWALLIGLGAALLGGVLTGAARGRRASDATVDVRESDTTPATERPAAYQAAGR